MKKNILFLFLTTSFYSFSQKHLNLKNKIAVKGYDVTEYFNKKAIKGLKKHSYIHHDAIYFFSSEKNKEKFKKNPDLYTPQYGGYCAYAIAMNGDKVDINPKTFKITNNKLYLFYNSLINNTLKSWNKEPEKLLILADRKWENIK